MEQLSRLLPFRLELLRRSRREEVVVLGHVSLDRGLDLGEVGGAVPVVGHHHGRADEVPVELCFSEPVEERADQVVVGGRVGGYEKALRGAREIAFEELESEAKKLGANAVLGIDIDYETLGNNGGMLMVTVAGTAVALK